MDAAAGRERGVAKVHCAIGRSMTSHSAPTRNGIEREHGDVNAAERFNVTHSTVDHDGVPAVLHCEMCHPVAEDRNPTRPSAVDHQYPVLARLIQHSPDERRIFECLDSGDATSQP